MGSNSARWKISCVIYDCDGVLFDSSEAITRLYNDLCAKLGREPLRQEEMTYVHTRTVYDTISFLFGGEGELSKKALETLNETEWATYVAYLKMEPFLLQTLNLLKAIGVLRAINTNRTTSMQHVMELFHLWPFFDMVVTALDVKNPKPHPESIEKIIQRFNLNKEEAVFIGDSEVDQQTAKSSGIKFIAYKNKEIANDAFLESHLDLLNFL
jgi:phosphoglycolate phosphatase